ncbi:MAG: sigma 54-interacting transcriptional regulator, partial [Pseudomonadota bacterium]
MKPVTALLGNDGFLKTLFATIPCGVLIVDTDRRVHALNNVIERSFGISEAEVINKRGGEALGCIHAYESPKGCGYSDYCANCKVRSTALDAIAGEQVHRNRAEVQVKSGTGVRDLVLLVSAAPMEFDKERLAVVILEDITELTRLRKYLRTEDGFAGIVGKDPRMLELFETIREIAETRVPVLIQGDSGTGKELVAAAIH